LIVIETKLASNYGFGNGFSEWDSGYPYRIDRNEADVMYWNVFLASFFYIE